MIDEAAFIRTVIDRPHDVGPRLVFSDWLEERGDPWAELIRRQCHLAENSAYKLADDWGRSSWEEFSDDLYLTIVDLGNLLCDHCSDWMLRLAKGSGIEKAVHSRWDATFGDLIWWRESGISPARTRLFWWKGFPERAEMNYGQWVSYHEEYMNALPLWSVKLTDRVQGEEEGELAVRAIAKWAGRLTTADLPCLAPANAFTAWMCNMLDAIGEKCHAATGRPFTLKIGQASMSGPPHSAAERWNRYAERWLTDSNVRIVSRLEARPVGELLPMQ